MITDDLFIGQLEDYLDRFDGETPLPERVRAEVHAALPAIRQVSARPARFWAGSTSGLSAAALWGVAAAGLVVAIAAGTVLVAANRDHGVAATQGPATPSPIPSATFPDAAAYLRSAPATGCVRVIRVGFECTEPGTYRIDSDVVPVPAAVDLPRGWFEWDPGPGSAGALVNSGSDALNGSGWGILFISPGRIRVDPCNPAAGFVPPAATAAEVVQAMERWPGFQVGSPQPISVGGYGGLLVEVTSTKTSLTCPTAEVMETSAGTAIDGYPMSGQVTSRPGQFRILEIAGKLMIVRTTDFPQESPFEVSQGVAPDPTRHVADQLALQAILDSLRFATQP